MIKIANEKFNIPLPSFSGMQMDYSTFMQQLLWIILAGVVLFVMMKFMQYRRLVKIYERVKDGYVVKVGRYNIKLDSEKKEYLKPMFGKKNLPSFPNECWQKSPGAPFIGVNRVLMVAQLNAYSFKVIYPPIDGGKVGITKYYDTLTWTFLEMKRKFIAKMKRGSLIQNLGIFAPSFVIIIWAIIMAVAMWGEATRNQQTADSINQVTAILKNIIEARG